MLVKGNKYGAAVPAVAEGSLGGREAHQLYLLRGRVQKHVLVLFDTGPNFLFWALCGKKNPQTNHKKTALSGSNSLF